jgi:hypothetical protein
LPESIKNITECIKIQNPRKTSMFEEILGLKVTKNITECINFVKNIYVIGANGLISEFNELLNKE